VNVLLDGIDVLHVFFGRIRVVETEVAQTAEFLGDAEIEADRLRVADVQISIRLGGKPSVDPTAVAPLLQIVSNDLANEVLRTNGFDCRGRFRHSENNDFNLAARRAWQNPITTLGRTGY
jgi:hypothetical protein